MSEVIEINHFDELAGRRLLWESLLLQTPGASFFHSFDWLEAYWRHYGHDQRLRVLIVTSGGQPVGILPLVVRREPTRVGLVPVLTYPLHDWGAFYSPIGPNPAATLAAGLGHVRRTRRDWDLLDLRWVDERHDRGRTVAAMQAAGFTPHSRPWDYTFQIDLTDGWEAYWASRTGKFRNNIRRYERRLAERGEVRYLRYRPLGDRHGDGDPRWDLFETCRRIAEASWQGSSTDGTTLSHDAVCSFLRDAHAAAAKAGTLDLNLLLLGDTPVAFAYNYHFRGYVYGLRVGFDASVARDGPGNLLYRLIVEDSCRRGDHTYDLGPGSLECKRALMNRVQPCYRHTHFPLVAPRAQVLRLKRWLQGTLLDRRPKTPVLDTAV